MDHPRDHTNDAVLPVVPFEEPVIEAASTSVSPDIQAPSRPLDTPAFQIPSHSQHEDTLPQLTAEQKEELMRIHTQLTSQENPVQQVTSFEFEEPRDQTEVYNEIFKEPQGKADVYDAIWGEPQGESDDSKSISEEESDQEELAPQGKPGNSKSVSEEESGQEEWTPRGKKKAGKAKINVKRKYTKRNSAKTQQNEASGT